MTKYGNRKTTIDAIVFDSLAEARRYGELKLLERAGELRGLSVHPRFNLVVNDVKLGYYEADFVYRTVPGDVLTVEDVKSPASRTAVYMLKRRLLIALYDIRITEIAA